MKPMKQVLRLDPSTYRDALYGVEIEVEGNNLPTRLSSSVWRIERDGSLKSAEAYEYVTPHPLSLAGVRSSLDYLGAAYATSRTSVDESIRAGVHVHMNVQDWNIKQLFTFTTMYYVLEDILTRWCGPAREGNLFCLRSKDAEFVLFRVLEALNNKNLRLLKDDTIRYSSLNYCSLFKYGSIEFRGMRGTGDLDAIYNWVQIINDLRESSLKFDDPVSVISTMSGDGGRAFLDRVLPNTAKLLGDVNDADELISESTRRVQMLAFGVNWASMGGKSVNIFKEEVW